LASHSEFSRLATNLQHFVEMKTRGLSQSEKLQEKGYRGINTEGPKRIFFACCKGPEEGGDSDNDDTMWGIPSPAESRPASQVGLRGSSKLRSYVTNLQTPVDTVHPKSSQILQTMLGRKLQ